MKKLASLKQNQQGIASLLFSMVMMIVITLIVLSFAQIARTGQREALDSQLSTQAFYAAESGVNDAAKAIGNLAAQQPAADLSSPTCTLTPTYQNTGMFSKSLDATNDVSYTCVKINPYLTTLSASVSPSVSKVLTIQPSVGVDSITIQWDPTEDTGNNGVGKCPHSVNDAFPTYDQWNCPYAVLRFDLVPTDDAGLNRAALIKNTMAVFAVPTNGSNEPPVSYQPGAKLAAANCTGKNCRLTVNGLIDHGRYSMRLMSKYRSANNVIVSNSAGANFLNGQVVVDATGKAKDVLRRVQVRLSLNGSHALSNYAIGTRDSICKHFSVSNSGVNDDPAGCTAQP